MESPPPTDPSKVLTTQARQRKFSKSVKVSYNKKVRISYYRGAPIVLAPPPLTTKAKQTKSIG